MERRSFLESVGKGLGLATATTLFGPLSVERVEAQSRRVAGLSAVDVAKDEFFWKEVQQAFSISRAMINLNNGGVCPSPRVVTEALVHYIWEAQQSPVYTMWRVQEPRKEVIRRGLARLFGCDAEEIAIVRNTSEALETLLLGLDLQTGDEVLTTTHDYGRMRTTLDQRRRREGIDIKMIPVPTPADNMEQLVDGFRKAITAKTKMILMCHQVNITGQIFPVKPICELAAEHGIEVVVDGAHSFVQFEFDHSDIGCDYFGTSLHKWLFAPIGTGMLYVRRDKIKKVWPLMAAREEKDNDIRKFEEIGTHQAAPILAIGEAIAFHNAIGSARKEARLRYLKNYWATRLMENDTIRLHTSLEPEMSCAIATVEIVGVDSRALGEYLWDNHHIIVAPIMHDEFQGLRITPNLYTQLEELDYFCEVMEHVATKGLPKTA